MPHDHSQSADAQEAAFLRERTTHLPNAGANKETMRQRIAAQTLWVTSNRAEGSPLKGRNEDFTGVDFTRAKLQGAEFVNCIFDYCNFRLAETNGATVFQNCHFGHALMIQMTMTGGQFANCTFTGIRFGLSRFDGVTISGMDDPDGPVTPSTNDFAGAHFVDARFERMNFFGAGLSGVTINQTTFAECQLRAIRFKDMTIQSSFTFLSCRMLQADFSGLSMPGSRFVDCVLGLIIFEGAILEGTEFVRSNLADARCQGAIMKGCKFQDSDAFSANFFDADLTDTEMRLMDLRECNFIKAKLARADLSGSDLLNAHINETTNRNLTNFAGCIWPDGARCGAGSIGVCRRT
jgi:uncharacterized protein YjbI with pentapeptide repeats